MAMKLSLTAHELLLVVEHASTRFGREDGFWAPPRCGTYFVPLLQRPVIIFGSGVATSLRSLERKGLVRLARPGQLGADYWYQITQAGKDWLTANPYTGPIGHREDTE